MLRREMIQGLLGVRKAISDTKLLEALRAKLERGSRSERTGTGNLLRSLHLFASEVRSFSPSAVNALRIFQLEEFLDPSSWQSIFETDNAGPMHLLYQRVYNAMEYVPRIVEFLTPETPIAEGGIPNSGAYVSSENVLTVYLQEKKNELSHPKRIADLMEAVSGIYDAVAEVNGIQNEPLLVLACDSGSNKGFDFKGAGQCVKEMKELILEMFDRIAFFKEKRFEQRIEVLGKSLSVVEKIGSLEKAQKIDREHAAVLRKAIFGGLEMLRECGAVIPEMDDRVQSISVNALMAPSQKLLSQRPEAPTSAVKNDPYTPFPEFDSEQGGSTTPEENIGLNSESFKPGSVRNSKRKKNT
jgi:hypothetical protein